MKKRALWFFTAVLVAFSGVTARLYQLTGDEIWQAADSQSTVSITVATARGTIYDRYLNPLTNAEGEYRAAVISSPRAMAALSQVLTEEELKAVSEGLQTGKPVVQTLKGALAPTEGLWQFVSPVRYSKDQVAAHVIGYLGDNGTDGVAGIEKAYNEELTAASGEVKITFRTDGTGTVLPGAAVTVENTLYRAKGGVALTLDSGVQRMVETRAASLVEKGAVVVMNSATGELLALASFPDFEPAALSDYLSRENSPLFNRAMAAYNCGSVFKIITAATALESGVAAEQTHTCYGKMQVGANVIHCHHRLGHGVQTMSEAFVNSCNPYFISLAQTVGGTQLHRMATSLGLGSALVLEKGVTTAPSTFPSMVDLLQSTALANVSFGQGSLTATPIHIAMATAAVIGGGTAYRPRLVVGTVDEAGTITPEATEAPVRFFSSNTAAALKEMMIAATKEGPGAAATPSAGGAGGKTGTAQTGWQNEAGDTMVHSWFTGFYPAEQPQYVITVVCEDAGETGKNAAEAFRAVCEGLYSGGYTTLLTRK